MHLLTGSRHKSIAEKLNKLITSLNGVFNWQVWPFTVAILAPALMITNQAGHSDWWYFVVLLLQLTLFISPVLVFKNFTGKQNSKLNSKLNIQLNKKLTILCWCLVFLGYPLLVLILENNLPELAALPFIQLETFVFIWIIEASLLFNKWLQSRQKKPLRFKFTLDHGLFALTLIFSLFWAAVFAPLNDPIIESGHNMVIDLKLVIFHWDNFLIYWAQIQLTYSIIFAYYYINRHILVNKVMARYGIFNYLWFTALFILFSYPLAAQLVLWLPLNSGEHTMIISENQNPFDWQNGSFALAVMLTSLPVILALEWAQKSQQLAEMEKQNIHTELLLLQQQINPHFLFNTLNNLYSLCLTKSEKAPELVQQLASLLRFVVYKGGQKTVPLSEEVQYLRDYLDLQQVRVSNKCQFEVDFEEESADSKTNINITPLLLIILIENAFKHGVEPSLEDAWLKVKLSRQGNTLKFYCGNSVESNYKPSQQGIGLENLQRRLALIYEDKYSLKINHEQHAFHVHLTLECQ